MTKTYPARILVVDDQVMTRTLISNWLTNDGYDVCEAKDGLSALDMLNTQDFDLVVLDIEMPKLSGIEVLDALGKSAKLNQLPVIVVSASEGVDQIVQCIERGAEDHLTKPVNRMILKARISASLEKKYLRDMQKKLLRSFATPEVIAEIEENGFELGGKIVHASILFVDIRSFTKMAETQSPTQTIDMLNNFFGLIFDLIAKHKGIVSQILGDGVMAIFGAPLTHPDHATQAVLAAFAMIEALNNSPLQIGIGIASGAMVAGYTGTYQRMSYTCVGDTVNLAARLQEMTKEYGRSILISEATQSSLPPHFIAQSHGLVDIRGKTDKVHIFSLNTPSLQT
ncbi:MAG: adenylate/guanylate cyclase domain-containing response regulator [Cytophagales bacterium]|nr:adenylate/guanylate cyclase domain-containing response regulator [Cytophagales bacterium]